MEDQYSMLPDLRHYRQMMFTAIPPPPPQPHQQPPPLVDLFAGHQQQQNLAQQHYEMALMRERGGFHHHPLIGTSCDASGGGNINNNSTTSNNTTSGASCGGLEMESGGNGRWPRQETLTLLEIRSRLDSKFKEANQKGPLWDQVSRIMSEEYGYQRSGKKCREKFENLYKYYKKTKEGKAGRQDGKHYRFFRQLEALYGETSNQLFISKTNLAATQNFPYNTNIVPNKLPINQDPSHTSHRLCDSLSLSNSTSGFENSSSDESDLNGAAGITMENDDVVEKRKKRIGKKRSWKTKIRDFLDGQMRKLMEKQEVWLEKMTKTIESKEQERMMREEEWRRQESARIDKEHKFWANERAWIEARDASLMEFLHKLNGKDLKNEVIRNNVSDYGIEINGSSDIDSGADRVINNYVMKMKEGVLKKRKENVRGGCYFEIDESMCNNSTHREGFCEVQGEIEANLEDERGRGNLARNNSNVGGSSTSAAMHDSGLKFYVGDGENLWENYGLKLNNGEN